MNVLIHSYEECLDDDNIIYVVEKLCLRLIINLLKVKVIKPKMVKNVETTRRRRGRIKKIRLLTSHDDDDDGKATITLLNIFCRLFPQFYLTVVVKIVHERGLDICIPSMRFAIIVTTENMWNK